MVMKPTHLFLIGTETLDSLDQNEIDATVKDLKTLDLYHLPYDRVSIRLPTDQITSLDSKSSRGWWHLTKVDKDGIIRPNMGPEHWVQFDNVNLLGEPYTSYFVCDGAPHWRPYRTGSNTDNSFMSALCDGLIVLLATRNVVKTTVQNKLCRLGIGKKRTINRFDYVTTISIPPHEAMGDDEDHPATGATKASHLRRGHIRRQHYGPQRAFIKMIWIAPVFVNADPDFVSTRKRYNLGGTVPHHSKKESA